MTRGRIHLKRVFESPEAADGRRYLVDRLWPRGVKKTDLALDGWLKEAAPSHELRRWFDHRKDRWPEFMHRYRNELREKTDLLQPVLEEPRAADVSLVYAARDEKHNNAIVLKMLLEELLSI